MMPNFKKNKKSGRPAKLLLSFLGFVLLFLLIFLVVADVRIYQKRKELSTQVEKLQSQIKDIQTRNANLQMGIKSQGDSQYIEKVAREELDLQKPGEQAVSFIAQKPDAQTVQPTKPNFFQGIWNWLTGKK